MSDVGALVRADAATGEIVWEVQLPEYFPNRGFFGRGKPYRAVPYYGPMLAGGRLWVAGADGLLRAFSPVDGTPLGAGAAAGRRGGGAGDRRGRALRRRPRTGGFSLSNSRAAG